MFLWEREGEFKEEEQFYRVADRLYFEVGRGWHSYIRGVPQGGNIGCDFYNWRKKYSGLLPSEMRRLRQLEEENGKLKRIVADLSLDKAMLQDVLSKKL